MRRTGPAIAVAVLALVVAMAPASAATVTVLMDNSYDFDPPTRTIDYGDKVKWKNNSSFEGHDVQGTAPSDYFSSGEPGEMGPGDTYSKLFRAAGSYPFTCEVHPGMDGRIKVRMGARKIDGGSGFRLTMASAQSSGYQHVLWVDRPGPTGWAVLRTTTSATYDFTPTASGQYKFKSQLRRVSDDESSGFSPVVKLTH